MKVALQPTQYCFSHVVTGVQMLNKNIVVDGVECFTKIE